MGYVLGGDGSAALRTTAGTLADPVSCQLETFSHFGQILSSHQCKTRKVDAQEGPAQTACPNACTYSLPASHICVPVQTSSAAYQDCCTLSAAESSSVCSATQLNSGFDLRRNKKQSAQEHTSTLRPPTKDCPPFFCMRAWSDRRIMPAQVPQTGRPSDTHCFRRGNTPHLSPISAIAVLSPPFIHGFRDRL